MFAVSGKYLLVKFATANTFAYLSLVLVARRRLVFIDVC